MYKSVTMNPKLQDYNEIHLTEEQVKFDERVAKEVMGWKKLDDSLLDSLERHVLPESEYPFYVITQTKGILVYHPTPYHKQMFSPSYSSEDDLTTFVTLLRKQPESLSTILSTLHFIHRQRGVRNAGFQPEDEFYRIARYYKPGDLATVALHVIGKESWRDVRDPDKALSLFVEKYGNLDTIESISLLQGTICVKCNPGAVLPQDMVDDIESSIIPVIVATA